MGAGAGDTGHHACVHTGAREGHSLGGEPDVEGNEKVRRGKYGGGVKEIF